MARTPLFSAVKRALKLAQLANLKDAPPLDEVLELCKLQTKLSRRRFLKTSAAVLGSSALASVVQRPLVAREHAPKVVIVGAGIAGLNAAYRLKQAGVEATVFEAADRTGGRLYSVMDLLAPGIGTDLGGSFINSEHEDMLALAHEFALPLVDLHGPGEAELQDVGYYVGGQLRSEREVVEAFRPLAARIARDAEASEEDETVLAELDRLSLEEYFDRIHAEGWVRELLNVIFVAEMGLEAGEQTALNFLWMFPYIDEESVFYPIGDSDERYRVVGGNERITQELTKRLEDHIETGWQLEAIRSNGRGFVLSFAQGDVEADFVILALPFSTLRNVAITVPLPSGLERFIHELAYGTHTKVFAGFAHRPWRERNSTGTFYSDTAFQLSWDDSRLQRTESGVLTFFSGGNLGLAKGEGTPEDQAARLLPVYERLVPGSMEAHNGRVTRFFWPSYPFTLGSYACFKPGQYTEFIGENVYIEGEVESVNVGNLFFAGEHVSDDYQGYMNGGAQSGRLAAQALLGRLD